jgi:hypothetical protein
MPVQRHNGRHRTASKGIAMTLSDAALSPGASFETRMKWARISGFLYTIVIVTGIFTFIYVPGQVVVPDDMVATMANIRSQELLYRAGIGAFLLNQIAFFLLPLALYVLLSPVNRPAAKVMVLAALMGIPIALLSAAERMLILNLVTGNVVVSSTALNDFVSLARAGTNNAVAFATTFWGLWLLPFGYLVFKSGFLPRILGISLMAGCFGYLINLFGIILVQDYTGTTIASILRLPASIGEIGIGLWLLLVGVRRARAKAG